MSGQVDYDEELVRVWALVNELSGEWESTNSKNHKEDGE